MLKILLLFAGIFIVYVLFSKSRRRVAPAKPEQPKGVEDMVRCGHCGVHLPKHESVSSDGLYFCCEEHRSLAKDRHKVS